MRGSYDDMREGALMSSIDLKVPYHDKELAKAAGARWDARRKVWYVVDRDDLTPLAKWLPRPSRINHRADSYVLLESRRDCWHCGRQTRVFGFAMPRGHEQLKEASPDLEFSIDAEYEAWLDGPDAIQWVAQDTAAVLSYVTHISEAALSRMHSLTMNRSAEDDGARLLRLDARGRPDLSTRSTTPFSSSRRPLAICRPP